MYTTQQIKDLQKLTGHLLRSLNDEKLYEKIEDIRKALRFHEYRYYVESDPLITDFEYDQLYKQLEEIEKQHPELITNNSPTQRVGSSLNLSFNTAPHIVPMLSLANSYNADDLLDWDEKNRELSGLTEVEYCIEPKFDGASISLIYENDLLVRCVDRK